MNLTTILYPSDLEGLGRLAKSCYNAAKDKGFWSDTPAARDADDTITYELNARTPPEYLRTYLGNKIALMHSELSEMLEGLRKPGPDAHLPERTQEEVEAADVLIRLLDYCGARGIDLGTVVAEKFAYNQSRPYKHGKAF